MNFAGYHAEAGLGALFGNGNLGGGLHASAGTPFGAHASARLGGNLDGERGGLGNFFFSSIKYSHIHDFILKKKQGKRDKRNTKVRNNIIVLRSTDITCPI